MRLPVRNWLILTAIIASLFLPISAQAQQTNIRDILRNTPNSRLKFSPNTVGVVIRGATNRVYTLNLKRGNELEVDVKSTGARAFVAVYDSNGKLLKTLSEFGQNSKFTYKVPTSGDYYIFCYGGPTNHFYDVTVVAQ